MHDNIGAQLTFIISSLDNLKYGFKIPEELSHKLKNISEFTVTTIFELRDTIWAMNKNEITFEDLQIRISNFIDKAGLASQHIIFDFQVSDEVDTSVAFTSVEGMNIYRIIQEAINNALKYADASKIEVLLSTTNGKLHIAIRDNGKGFNLEKVKQGNGFRNMRKRADEIGGNLTVETFEGKGTTINLMV